MLELYHHGSTACAAKVRFALAEKGLAAPRVADKVRIDDGYLKRMETKLGEQS